MKKLIFILVMLGMVSFANAEDENFIAPNKSVGVEITHRDLLFPISAGISYSFNNGIVFSGSMKVSNYFSVMGEFWQNPEMGNRWGIFISPYIDLFKVKLSEQTKTKIQAVPFYGVTLSNDELGMVNFGIKIVMELQ